MSEENNIPKSTPSRAQQAEIFSKRYEELCRETGFQITFEPHWVQSKDMGDYRLVIIASVVPFKEAG